MAAGLTSLSLSLPPFVSLSSALLTVNRLVPMVHQTWGGVAWLPGRKKLKSHKGIAPPLLPLMNAVFYGRQSGRRSTPRDDRTHSHGKCVSVCWWERAPSDCPLSDVRTGGFWCVEEQVKGKTPVHFNSALAVFSWLLSQSNIFYLKQN